MHTYPLSSGNGHTDLNSNLLIFTIDLIFFQRKENFMPVMLEYFSIFLAGIFVTFSGQRSGFHPDSQRVHDIAGEIYISKEEFYYEGRMLENELRWDISDISRIYPQKQSLITILINEKQN